MAKRKSVSSNGTKDRNAKTPAMPTNGHAPIIPSPDGVIDLEGLAKVMPASLLRRIAYPDPSTGVDDAPPNYGDQIIPQISTVVGRIATGQQIYWPADQALRNMRVNAPAMLNELTISECLESRYRSTAMLKWHVEPEDESDPGQKECAAELQLMLERIGLPLEGTAATQNGFLEYRRYLMEAIWYGRVAIQNAWNWVKVRGKMRCIPTKWIPINGDKLVFRWDDGSGQYEDGQIGIRVTMAGFPGNPLEDVERKVEPADYSQAYMLDPYERQLLVCHKYMIEDGQFEDPYGAGAIHGIGIRSRIYWTWYQMQNAMAWFMEYMERTAFGIEIWRYPASNPAAEAATRKTAANRVGGGRTMIMVPVFPGDESLNYGLQYIEPGMQGVEMLKTVIGEFFGHKIKRYILGQTLTSEAEATGMGSEVANLHAQTFDDIIRYDSQKLAETLTTDLVTPMVRFNFPQYRDTYFRFVIDTEPPDNDKKLEAIYKAYTMGLKIKSSDVYPLIGCSPPSETDEVLGGSQPAGPLLGGAQTALEKLTGRPGEPPTESNLPTNDQPQGDNDGGESGLDIPAVQPDSTDDPSGLGLDRNQREYDLPLRMSVADAASDTDHEASADKKESGKYRKGKVTLHGLTIAIENPIGTVRSGTNAKGEEWRTLMRHHYGYFTRHDSDADGDEIDVFIGPHPESQLVTIINQIDPATERFDEHKVIMGAESEQEARDIYDANYQHGWTGRHSDVTMSLEAFKEWLKNADTSKPAEPR